MFPVIQVVNLHEKQAGLLLYTKEFTNFVWEEKWIVLDMQYFYFRKSSFPFCWSLKSYLYIYIYIYGIITFSAFIILGIGSGVSLIVFMLEHLFVKYNVWKEIGTLGLLSFFEGNFWRYSEKAILLLSFV